jgi:hypothetical protein
MNLKDNLACALTIIIYGLINLCEYQRLINILNRVFDYSMEFFIFLIKDLNNYFIIDVIDILFLEIKEFRFSVRV